MKSANDKVVLALIGAGGRGTFIILGIQKCTPGVEVKYICDVDKERGGRAINELEKQQKVKPIWIEDMRRAMDDKDVDGVVIATPEQWHATCNNMGMPGREGCICREKYLSQYY